MHTKHTSICTKEVFSSFQIKSKQKQGIKWRYLFVADSAQSSLIGSAKENSSGALTDVTKCSHNYYCLPLSFLQIAIHLCAREHRSENTAQERKWDTSQQISLQ